MTSSRPLEVVSSAGDVKRLSFRPAVNSNRDVDGRHLTELIKVSYKPYSLAVLVARGRDCAF